MRLCTQITWIDETDYIVLDSFPTANGVLPVGSVTATIQHTNAHITQNNTTKNKQNKEK
jgi:hypothetical protein